MGTPALVLSQESQFLLYTRLGEVAGGDVGVGRGHSANSLEFKHSTIYKKMFYRVNTLLGSLIESCKGLVQMRDPPPKDSGFISFILNPSVGLIISWLRDPLGPPKSSVNMGSAGQDSSTGPTPRMPACSPLCRKRFLSRGLCFRQDLAPIHLNVCGQRAVAQSWDLGSEQLLCL